MKYLFWLLFPFAGHAQTFFVSGLDKYSVRKISEKVRYEGYIVTADSATANYVVNLLIDGHYKALTVFKLSYQGYILLTDRATGDIIGKTKTAQANPAALNGYNAALTIFTKIARKYLSLELKKCRKK
jgi:hypothetical protein